MVEIGKLVDYGCGFDRFPCGEALWLSESMILRSEAAPPSVRHSLKSYFACGIGRAFRKGSGKAAACVEFRSRSETSEPETAPRVSVFPCPPSPRLRVEFVIQLARHFLRAVQESAPSKGHSRFTQNGGRVLRWRSMIKNPLRFRNVIVANSFDISGQCS